MLIIEVRLVSIPFGRVSVFKDGMALCLVIDAEFPSPLGGSQFSKLEWHGRRLPGPTV